MAVMATGNGKYVPEAGKLRGYLKNRLG